jgi:murein DD-endopeptidase MepM/ murein hydrolase activator NlpD
MQEWATLFTTSQEAHLFKIKAYYDYDVKKGSTKIYNGSAGPTYDQHDGLDASCPRGTEIVSAAEGRVIGLYNDSTVAILHPNNLISVYGHGIPLVEINQYVPRGYPIALCDELLTNAGPHVHFSVWRDSPWLNRVIFSIPVYADLIIETERWMPVVKPLNDDHDVYILIGGRGIWTEINKPHFPYVRFDY